MMGAPLKHRRSGFLHRLKGITRHSSKHDHHADITEPTPPRGILTNNILAPVPSVPRAPNQAASTGSPRRLNVSPKDAHCWSYWGPTQSLSDRDLEALMGRHCYELTGALGDPHFRSEGQTSGAHNTVYFLQSTVGYQVKICVRVPAWGWVDRWNETDAELLRATALGMRLVKERCGLPVPEVLAYDMTMDNELGAPYIIMTFLEGVTVDHVWNGIGSEEPQQIEARRQRILRSLASTMSLLDKTRFSQSGTLCFPDYHDDRRVEIGPSWCLDPNEPFALQRSHTILKSRGSLTSYLEARRANRVEEDRRLFRGLSHYRKGVFDLWAMMIRVFLQSTNPGEGEPHFVLMHPDFDQNNIIVDEKDTVVGIIGWDRIESVPRQTAWCSAPNWLQNDWSPTYQWPPQAGVESSLHPDEYALYRQDYTTYMREACGNEDDCRFTAKSHIYRALCESVESFEAVEHFVYNVLAAILPRSALGWRKQLGDIGEVGFRPGEQEWLEKKLYEYFTPDAGVGSGPIKTVQEEWL